MKRLMVAAAIAAMSAGLFAAEEGAAAKAGDGVQAVQQPAAEAAARGGRPAGAPFDRAKFEERMKKIQEERRGKVADILKAAGVAADKVDAVVDEIDKVYVRRRPSPRMRRPGGPNASSRRQPAQRPQAAPAKE